MSYLKPKIIQFTRQVAIKICYLSLELNFSCVEAMNLVSGMSGQTICSRELSVRPNLERKEEEKLSDQIWKTVRTVTLLSDSFRGSCFHWWRCGRRPLRAPFAGSWWTSPAAWSRQPARRTWRRWEEKDSRNIRRRRSQIKDQKQKLLDWDWVSSISTLLPMVATSLWYISRSLNVIEFWIKSFWKAFWN